MPTASRRENSLKARERDWKLRLIEATNPDWNDLSPGLFGEGLDAADWLATDFPDDATCCIKFVLRDWTAAPGQRLDASVDLRSPTARWHDTLT